LSLTTAPRTVFRVHVGASTTLVLKINTPNANAVSMVGDRTELSKRLGWAREAAFFKNFTNLPVPRCVYADYDMATGTKVIVMEDLGEQYVNCATLFGAGTPHNRGKDLAACQERAGNPSLANVVKATFKLYAQMHARCWDQVLPHTWLRGRDAVVGNDDREFLDAARCAAENWATVRAVSWFDPLVSQALDKAVEGTTWENLQTRLRNGHWTLVHGDCWPGNSMWRHDGTVKLIDWEMCGLGSGRPVHACLLRT